MIPKRPRIFQLNPEMFSIRFDSKTVGAASAQLIFTIIVISSPISDSNFRV